MNTDDLRAVGGSWCWEAADEIDELNEGNALLQKEVDALKEQLASKESEIAALKFVVNNLTKHDGPEIAALKALIGRIEAELIHAEINDMRLTPAFGKVIGRPAVPLANIRAAITQVVQP